MGLHQQLDLAFIEVAFPRESAYLKVGGCRRDIRVEARSGRRNQVNRHGCVWTVGAQNGSVLLHSVDQLPICRPEICSARIRRVIARSRRRRPGVKVTWTGKRLADDSRADHLTVAK